MEEDQLLMAADVAKRLGVSRRHAWLLGRRGVLPTIRVGRRQVRYSLAALNGWIAAGGLHSADGLNRGEGGVTSEKS